tara:strand:+ start:314 stop:958 length:645 start_codon:yes stop_codon:yes gene_type:complete
MKNTIWFFGDCYTSGAGLHRNEDYYQYKEQGDDLWTKIVADKLEMNHQKPEIGLTAYPWIINEFIKSLHKMKKGDIVIFGDTMPDGVLTYNKDRDKIYSFNCHDILDYESCWSWRTEEEKETTLPYIEYHKLPYREQWTNFYTDQVMNISKEILNRGIKTFYWFRSIWDNFETIDQATNGKIKDGHWSWKGQKQMADYILKMIKDNRYIKQDSI